MSKETTRGGAPREERLSANEIRPHRGSHLELTETAHCEACAKPCVAVCPAGTYAWSGEQGRILISHENCLECGSCRGICPYSVIRWKNPFGGTGICYRYG